MHLYFSDHYSSVNECITLTVNLKLTLTVTLALTLTLFAHQILSNK